MMNSARGCTIPMDRSSLWRLKVVDTTLTDVLGDMKTVEQRKSTARKRGSGYRYVVCGCFGS